LNKLDKLGLQPNKEADKERLLKRVSFDLTGLPPTIQMMDAFNADNSSTAYEKVVDQLMLLRNMENTWQFIGSMLHAMQILTATRMTTSARNGHGEIG